MGFLNKLGKLFQKKEQGTSDSSIEEEAYSSNNSTSWGHKTQTIYDGGTIRYVHAPSPRIDSVLPVDNSEIFVPIPKNGEYDRKAVQEFIKRCGVNGQHVSLNLREGTLTIDNNAVFLLKNIKEIW